MSFDDFNWHDSIVKNINIDRDKPGINDIITFDIEWAQGGNIQLVFEETYWANMMLNFGIVADETILDANIEDSKDSDLVEFYSKWKGSMDSVSLNIYSIKLNSTGGLIKIIAKGFKVIEK